MLPSSHSTNLHDKILTNCSSFLMSFSSYQKKFWTRKFNEYYTGQSADSKNTADPHLQVDASADFRDNTDKISYSYMLLA